MTDAALEFLSRRGRAVWSLLLFVVALVFLAALASEGHFSPAAGELGPRFWPRLWLVVMLLLTALDAALALRQRPAVSEKAATADRAPESRLLLLAGTILVIAYAALMNFVGFAPATLAFLLAFSYLGGYRRLPSLLLVAFATTFVLTYVFVYVVYISLPLGVGPFLDINVSLYRLLGIY
jgi:putative tricarboxylic transport membrane protein